MADFTLYPLNDFAKFLRPKDIDSATGEVAPLTTGIVTAFLATAFGPTATAAHASLSVPAIHLTNGKWLVFIDASVLDPTLLDTLFSTTPPYLIVQYPSGFRVYYSGEYQASRPGIVA